MIPWWESNTYGHVWDLNPDDGTIELSDMAQQQLGPAVVCEGPTCVKCCYSFCTACLKPGTSLEPCKQSPAAAHIKQAMMDSETLLNAEQHTMSAKANDEMAQTFAQKLGELILAARDVVKIGEGMSEPENDCPCDTCMLVAPIEELRKVLTEVGAYE